MTRGRKRKESQRWLVMDARQENGSALTSGNLPVKKTPSKQDYPWSKSSKSSSFPAGHNRWIDVLRMTITAQ